MVLAKHFVFYLLLIFMKCISVIAILSPAFKFRTITVRTPPYVVQIAMTAKEKLMKMTLEEKRSLYRCGSNFTTLKDIETWQDYYEKNKTFLKAQYMEMLKNQTSVYATNCTSNFTMKRTTSYPMDSAMNRTTDYATEGVSVHATNFSSSESTNFSANFTTEYNTNATLDYPANCSTADCTTSRTKKISTDRPDNFARTYPVNKILNRKISLLHGDITSLEIDAIVNPANRALIGGEGVDGVIHKAAGTNLMNDCIGLRGCVFGEAKMSYGYKLPAKYVIHAAPAFGEKPDILESCYKQSFDIIFANKLRTVAFPSVGTGHEYPREAAAHVALRFVRSILEKQYKDVDRIIFCLWRKEDVEIYEKLLQWYFPVENHETSFNRTMKNVS